MDKAAEYNEIIHKLNNCLTFDDVVNSFPNYGRPSTIGRDDTFYDTRVIVGKHFVIKDARGVRATVKTTPLIEKYKLGFEKVKNFLIQERCDITEEAREKAKKFFDVLSEKYYTGNYDGYWDYHGGNYGLLNGEPILFDY